MTRHKIELFLAPMTELEEKLKAAAIDAIEKRREKILEWLNDPYLVENSIRFAYSLEGHTDFVTLDRRTKAFTASYQVDNGTPENDSRESSFQYELK
jgi:hypothetical protein